MEYRKVKCLLKQNDLFINKVNWEWDLKCSIREKLKHQPAQSPTHKHTKSVVKLIASAEAQARSELIEQ